MGQKCLLIHEKRFHVGKKATQLVENGKTMGIDIPPIIKVLPVQPRGGGKVVKAISRPENDQCIRNLRKGQKVDLVFSDEDLRYWRIKGGKGGLSQGDILICFDWQQSNIRGQHPKTNSRRFVDEPIPPAEAADARVHPINAILRQDKVKEFRQYPAMAFDQFGMNTRQIDLSQIYRGPRMGQTPGDNIQ